MRLIYFLNADYRPQLMGTYPQGVEVGFAKGDLKRLIHGKKGTFNGYDIAGDWLEDVNGKRGWLVQIVGLETGSFSVVDGEIHQSGIHTPGSVPDSTDVVTSPQKADLSESTKKAISDAIAQWEKEALEKDPSLKV